MGDRTRISVRNLTHSFSVPGSEAVLPVLEAVSFEVMEAELLCLVGPSGCGKTTLLKLLAGLIATSEGTLQIDGRSVNGPSPDRVLLFQELYLFHWMTALGNVEFALEAKGVPKAARRDEAADILEFVGLKGFQNYYPHEISGGMRQRLALARALAAEPSILLMDEPFGSLDVETRAEMENEFLALREVRNFTTILVTHDVRQAIFLGDRVLVMSQRPATINMNVSVPFARPRQPCLRQSTEFHAWEDRLARSIRSGG